MSKPRVLQFHEFCEKVLKLHLTLGQRVIAKVAFGNYQPADLPEDERAMAMTMFGGLEVVDEAARKYIVMYLGRGSGKTTICSAFAVYTCVTFDVSRAGPGSVPYAIVVAPDKETAKLSIRMSREMIRTTPSLERLVVNDEAQSIQLRRPDGRFVKIEAFAASRGGSAMRGRDIMVFLLDEAAFFTSNGGFDNKDYSVNDKDIFRALKPRLMPGGRGMLISTPWPTETLIGEMFDANWGKCKTAIAIKAPTLLVRGDDPDIKAMVDDELSKDPENARRELFCELDGFTGGEFFDANALGSSLEVCDFPVPYNPLWPSAVGCDLGFTKDSSAVVVVQFDGTHYRLVHAEEMRPRPGKPLQPSEVFKKFSEVTKRYRVSGVVADTYYREALREQLNEAKLTVFPAPEGTRGKADVFHRTRAVLHEGNVKLPDCAIVRRMIQQAKLVTSKATPGGQTTVRIPRKIGLGHGDLVSAWVLAVHRLAHAKVETNKEVLEPGTVGWFAESQRRMVAYQAKQQADYLKKTEKDVMLGLNERHLRQFYSSIR